MSKATNSSLILRDLLGITQQELAELLGFTRASIAKVESEARKMNTQLLQSTGYWERIFFYTGQMYSRNETIGEEELEIDELDDFRLIERAKAQKKLDSLQKQLVNMKAQFEKESYTIHLIRSFFKSDHPDMKSTFCIKLLSYEEFALKRLHTCGPLKQYDLNIQIELLIRKIILLNNTPKVQ